MEKMGIAKGSKKYKQLFEEQKELEEASKMELFMKYMLKDYMEDDDPYGDGDQSPLKGTIGLFQVYSLEPTVICFTSSDLFSFFDNFYFFTLNDNYITNFEPNSLNQ